MNDSWIKNRGEYIAIYGGWAAVFLAVVVAYWPGLSGPWLFDDFGSIAKLGEFGGVRNWDTFKAFVFGGTAGPTGRPLALLTFLIDGQNWPTDAWPFKRTNLVIHILNGALLGLLISKILAALRFERQKIAQIALMTSAFWMLHPFFVSTTLYVVQRMAQLSTLFIFAGLIGYVHGRMRVQAQPKLAYLIMSISLSGFTLLAMLSKENGILLPVLALVLEVTIFANSNGMRPNRYWLSVFLVVPSVVIFVYLANRVFNGTFFDVIPSREFSIYERLLTQSRVIVDYLQNLLIPKLYTTGIFQDHYIKSQDLVTPITTLTSAVFHVVAVCFAIAVRRRWSLLSLAILFFYTGHLLESTVLNLELYFEHRNYLPAALLFLPIAVLLRDKLEAKSFFLVGVLLLALLGSFTRFSATVWQDYDLMVAASAAKAPTSARAQAKHAANLYNAGNIDEAFEVLERAEHVVGSGKPLVLIHRLILLCHTNRIDVGEFERVANILSGTAYDSRMLNMYRELADAIVDGHCPVIAADGLRQIFVRMLQMPVNNDPTSIRYSQLNYFLGYVLAHANEPDAAVEAFKASLRSRPGASAAMAMAAELANNNHHEAALVISDIALQQIATLGSNRNSNISEGDIRGFQDVVRRDLSAERAGDTLDPAE